MAPKNLPMTVENLCDECVYVGEVGVTGMRQMSRMTLLGLLAFILGGCQFLPPNLFGGGGEAEQTPSPGPVVANPPGAANTPPGAAAPAAEGEEPFNEPVVEESPQGILPADLIASTNPDERARSIQTERPDPFALIPITPIVEVQEGSTPPPTNNGNELAPVPSSLIPSNPIPVGPPPPPPTDLARAVKVTGVVQIGTTVHAIVSAPNEPSSRYVRAGQYLSNGQVLVKRIEMYPGQDPIIILEQNGIEVSVRVGEGGVDSATALVNYTAPAGSM
jgi:hypothetical protein